VFHAMLVVFEL